MNNHRTTVLITAFQCKFGGKSEGYSAYKWVEQIARFNRGTLLTVDDTTVPDGIIHHKPSKRFRFPAKILNRLNGELKLDYFLYDYFIKKKFGGRLEEFDLVHHVSPIAPRYPCSIGRLAPKFILGPIGGCQRVPEKFRSEVEGDEPFYTKLRHLDPIRLKHDPMVRKTLEAADLIIIVGAFMYDILPEQYHSKCRVMLETGIDVGEVPHRPKTSVGTDGRIQLLYVGRVVPYKGLIYVLRALAALQDSTRLKYALTIVGDNGDIGYEQQCKTYVENEGLDSVVRFLGLKPKEEIFGLYDACDLFVFPSLAETSGNVVIEAMAVGRPAMVAGCGGPREVVTDDSGYVIDPASPEELVRDMVCRLEAISKDPSVLLDKGILSRKRIEEKFDWDRKGEVLHGWYQDVLSGSAAGKGMEQ